MARANFWLCLTVLVALELCGSDEPELLSRAAAPSEVPVRAVMPSAVSLLEVMHEEEEVPVEEEEEEAEEEEEEEAAGARQCSACAWREQSRALRLETIKSQILSKLRLKHAPNISRAVAEQLLPRAPPLQRLLDQHDFQGDAAGTGAARELDEFTEADEYHATTESVIAMASERECHKVYNFACAKTYSQSSTAWPKPSKG